MTELLELLKRPEALVAAAAILIILMMLLAIMLRMSRRDTESEHQLALLRQDMDEKLGDVRKHTEEQLVQNRAGIDRSVEKLNDGVAQAIASSGHGQQARFDEYARRMQQSVESESERSRIFSANVERRMNALDARIEQQNADQARRIENMRAGIVRDTVNAVNARMDEVLGDMTAQLNRLSGEISRLSGTADEIKFIRESITARPDDSLAQGQLDALFAQLLSPGRFVRHFEIGTGSGNFADYAILIPDDAGQMLYLPVDAGFTAPAYAADATDASLRALARSLEDRALAVSGLIKPGLTTDFALMLIPSEQISARVSALEAMQRIQQTLRVIPVGPSSLIAMVRALEGGMNALAMQRHSREVETLLEEVRSELQRFSHMLGDESGSASAAIRAEAVPQAAASVPVTSNSGRDAAALPPRPGNIPHNPTGTRPAMSGARRQAAKVQPRQTAPVRHGADSDLDIWQ